MRRSLPDLIPWALLLAVSSVVLTAMRLNPALDVATTWKSPAGHFEVVTLVAAICAVVGVATSIVVVRTPNVRLLCLTLSFVTLTGLVFVHGAATPGFAVDAEYNLVIGFSMRLAFVFGALFLAASAIQWEGRAADLVNRYRVIILGSTLALLVGYAVLALVDPEWVPAWFSTSGALAWGTTTFVCALGGFAAVRYFAGYRRSQLPLYGAVTLGAVLFVQAQIAQHLGATWGGTFWLYHLQLLTGFGAILWGIAVEYGRGRALRSIEELTVSDIVAQLRSGQTESIAGLAAALEARDGYTLGHGERVAALAIFVGRELKLSTPRLRALAAGALLHDVGKIGVPDAVLHKHGPLDPEERAVIEEHPERGDTMLAAAFNGVVERGVIRHHHERWDGSGYPDRLAAEAIPLEARIVAVADVYDALRSNRAYRPAWEREDAVSLIVEGAGTQFDPRCVAALHAVIDQWEAQYAADHLAYDERRAA